MFRGKSFDFKILPISPCGSRFCRLGIGPVLRKSLKTHSLSVACPIILIAFPIRQEHTGHDDTASLLAPSVPDPVTSVLLPRNPAGSNFAITHLLNYPITQSPSFDTA